MIGVEMFKTKVEEPKREPKGKYLLPLAQFMESDNKTLKFNCSNEQESKNCYNCLMLKRKTTNLNVTVWRKHCLVYVIKG